MKIHFNNKTYSIEEFIAEYGFANSDFKTSNEAEFLRSIQELYSNINYKQQNMLPKKPKSPVQAPDYKTEYIDFQGPSSIWIDDNRSEDEKYKKISKTEAELNDDKIKFEEEMRNFKDKEKQYEANLSAIQQSKKYLNYNSRLEKLQKIYDDFQSAVKIPEWPEIYKKFNDTLDAIRKDGSSKPIVDLLDNFGKELNADQTAPEKKIHHLIEKILIEYRKILRGGFTGLFATVSGNKLVMEMQNFFKESFNIELPKSLEKGEELNVQSLLRSKKLDKDLYEHMTNESLIDTRFNIQKRRSSDDDGKL